jgi:uncharacterized protein YjcR
MLTTVPASPRIDWADAFAYYVQLGWQRRYADVADRFGVSLTAVKEYARSHGWQRRIAVLEHEAERRADRTLTRMLIDARCRRLERRLRIVERDEESA